MDGAALKIKFDAPDHFVGGDQVHATWKLAHNIHTKRVRPIEFLVVTEGLRSPAPAAATRTTGQRTDGVYELMIRIRLPVRRLASASNYDARTFARRARAGRHSGRHVHEGRNGTKNALGVMHQQE